MAINKNSKTEANEGIKDKATVGGNSAPVFTPIGTNLKVNITGSMLTIKVDLSAKGTDSKSGKNVLIASSQGNAAVGSDGFKLGLNVYKPKE